MDKVTQSNAANAEESASAAEELNAQAENLKEAVHDLLTIIDGDNKNMAKSAAFATPSKKIRTQSLRQPSLIQGNRGAKPGHNGERKESETVQQTAAKEGRSIPMADDFKNF
jgi:methyl-accepting chemotaxis protein